MKTEFYLRSMAVLQERVKLLSWLLMGGFFIVALYIRDLFWGAIVFLPWVFFEILAQLIDKKSADTGLYIKGNRVYIKWMFSEEDVLLHKIAGIKIMHMYRETSDLEHYPGYYADGSPIYVIILLSEISQAMYNYKNNYCYFRDDFIEEIMYVAEFDPEAVKYLKTLNPDIKVFY